MKTQKTNNEINVLISTLKEQSRKSETPLWSAIADEFERSTRQHRVVNISHIDKNSKDNDVIIVPGKVLGAGIITKKVTVAAQAFSGTAKQQIMNAKGTCITIQELMTKHPKGTNVKVIG